MARPQRQFGGAIVERADKESLGAGRWILVGVGGWHFWSAYSLSQANGGDMVYVIGALGVLFLVLAALAARHPVATLGVGLAIYVAELALTSSGSVGGAASLVGIVFKVLIFIALSGALAQQRALANKPKA